MSHEANTETDQLRSGSDVPLRGLHLRGNGQADIALDCAPFRNAKLAQMDKIVTNLPLFSVPVILLEPVKFVAAYIAATGNFIVALVTFAFGELLKIVLIERLFDLTRDKLMKISAFA
jgi:hypothetical protein